LVQKRHEPASSPENKREGKVLPRSCAKYSRIAASEANQFCLKLLWMHDFVKGKTRMAEVRYLVVKRNGAWKIVSGSLQMGPYADRLLAIDAAIELADRSGRDGRDSQVLVRGEDKRLRIEWTYGRDPFPEVLPH
jgi:hypothetical protein